MNRKILIVPKNEKPEKYLKMAFGNDTPEIVSGIPDVLSGKVLENELPLIYTEIIPDMGPIITLEERVKNLEIKTGIYI